MDKDNILKELYAIKHFIFRNTISGIDYMKMQRETGESLPFYKIIVRLNDVIQALEKKNF